MKTRDALFSVMVTAVFFAGIVPVWGDMTGRIDIDERLGQPAALDAVFSGEKGEEIILKDVIKRPTIISLVYLGCRHTCPMLLSGLAGVLAELQMTPGKDYEVITISFDENDTSEIAFDKKRNYLKAIGKPFPEESWRFLTGNIGEIKKFTASVGFSFRREEHGFSHPVALIILSPGGKIVRYLYGVSFLPFDLKMALSEASEGRVGSTTRKVLLYCYSYDPLEKTYVFNILKVAGTIVVIFLISFFAYLMFAGRKKERAT
jgi:protein SCO1/2